MIVKKQRKKKSKNYFTSETEDAILLYNKTEDYRIRDRIYSRYIHYPFFKLTQNIIHTFKFYHTDVEDLEHLQHEIIVFLLDRLHKYHHSKSVNDRLTKIITKEFLEYYPEDGFLKYSNNSDKVTQQQINDYISTLDVTNDCLEKISKITPPKAYSYFGTIVKRYLITYNKLNYEDKKNNYEIGEEVSDEEINFNYSNDDYEDVNNLNQYMDLFIEYCTENIYDIFPKGVDAKIADSILELFRKRENIEVFNKKALYIYIREMVDAKTPKITKISKTLYNIFKTHYPFYLENGYVEFQK